MLFRITLSDIIFPLKKSIYDVRIRYVRLQIVLRKQLYRKTIRMKKRTIFCVIALVAVSTSGYAQSSIWLSLAAKSNSPNLMFTGDRVLLENSSPEYRELPLYQADFGVSIPFAKSAWSFDAAVSYRSTKRTISGVVIGLTPFDPTPGRIEDYKYTRYLRFLGVRFGPSYALKLKKSKKIVFGFGLESYAPVGSKNVLENGDDVLYKRNIYRNGQIESGLFYGLYFRPSYQFKFSKNPRSKWNISIYGEGNLMFLNGSKSNPKWAGGGGVQLSFDLS